MSLKRLGSWLLILIIGALFGWKIAAARHGDGFSRMQQWIMASSHQKWLQRLSGLLLIGVSLSIVWNG